MSRPPRAVREWLAKIGAEGGKKGGKAKGKRKARGDSEYYRKLRAKRRNSDNQS